MKGSWNGEACCRRPQSGHEGCSMNCCTRDSHKTRSQKEASPTTTNNVKVDEGAAGEVPSSMTRKMTSKNIYIHEVQEQQAGRVEEQLQKSRVMIRVE